MFDQIKREIQEPYYKDNYPNDGQRFVAWYLRNIHLRDMNETKADITDGADDKQIDAIVIDDDKSMVFVLQGKFISTASVDAEPLREVLAAWLQMRDLKALQEAANAKLKRKLSDVATALEDDYEIAFELITTGELTPAAQKDLANFQKQLADLSEKDDLVCTIAVVDPNELRRRYDMALDKENPSIHHTIDLSDGHYMVNALASTNVAIMALPLKECIKIPGISDGTLFQKNVRQSLGINNAVNKAIRNTIYSDKYKDFFFFHNGITAICNKLEKKGDKLTLKGLSVVNGCQSLNTILSCSERVKELEDTYVLFRVYEIPQRERADRISINTNSQSAVKPRDLRSNDKRVLALKKQYELKYPSGYFKTKRGEQVEASKSKAEVIDFSDLGKFMIAWHSQRPNISYSEAKIFDKYFEQLFKRDYKPGDAFALQQWYNAVLKAWEKENPLGFNETLLAMRAYAPFHHLYAVSMCFAIANGQAERVPNPSRTWELATAQGKVDEIVRIAGTSVNMALEAAANEPQPANRVFSPHNWIKAKSCLAGINAAVRNYYSMLPMMPGGPQIKADLDKTLKMDLAEFEYRWAAD